MHRSRTQIATSYAPGSLFTYEGGLGCCVSVPVSTPYAPSSLAVPKQLFEHLEEVVESWFDRAKRCREVPKVLPEQCIDDAFLDYKKEPLVDQGKFVLTRPSRIGFVPDPLVFVCSDCGRLLEFDSIVDLHQRWPQAEKRTDCQKSDSKHHRWKQMDVIFAHWSGNYSGLSPYRWVKAPDGRVDQIRRCRNCGQEEYQLVTNSSPFFSDWRFQCVNCLAQKDVVQSDRETLDLLKPRMDAGHGNLAKEWNMLPVSYRASSVFYVQKDNFILFRGSEATTLLSAARRPALIAHLMELYDFPGTPLTDDEVVRQLKKNGRAVEADDYTGLVNIRELVPEEQRPIMDRQLSEKRQQYEVDGLICEQRDLSPVLIRQAEESRNWARRYNSIRLSIEHASLRSEVIDCEGTDPVLPAISVLNPDVCDIDSLDAKERAAYTERVQSSLCRLGIEELVMLRRLDICEFSFGYTRVSSTPSTTVKELDMPVRLRAFDYAEKNRRPIYLLEQKNEGLYVRLNEQRVIQWLIQNKLGADLPPRKDMRLGGLLIEQYTDFGRFLDDYKERTAESKTQRTLPNYVYLLLHTMAHHFAHAVVEYSGLEHGSIGEYLFPADLAFLVYRRGMTPDLGNLSAMWRNHNDAILGHLLGDRALKCNGGSLCDQRGGACPACIMAPEVSCLAGNNLLSRAALRGGIPPGWDVVRAPIVGYFRLQSPMIEGSA